MIQLIQDFVLTFSSILWEALPFIVLGAVVAGVLEELLPQAVVTRFMPKSVLPAVLIGGALGLIFPMCECGIVVVMRRLLKKGVPLSSCVAYMLAGPILNPVVLFSTYVAFEGHQIPWLMVGLRAGLGFLVAVITGLVVHSIRKTLNGAELLTASAAPKGGVNLPLAEADAAPVKRKTVGERLGNISATALHDFIDITVFLILGAMLAAVAKLYVGPGEIERLSHEQPFLSIPIMMLTAVVMCLCSEADAFVAASFTGMTVSSKLAFLVLGPMLDLKLLLMYTRVFRPKLIAVLVACSVVQVFVFTTAVHLTPGMDVKRIPVSAGSVTTAPAQPTAPK